MTVTPRSEVGYVYGMETERKLCFWLTLIVFMNRLVSINSIVFIGNTPLLGALTY